VTYSLYENFKITFQNVKKVQTLITALSQCGNEGVILYGLFLSSASQEEAQASPHSLS